MGCLNGTVSGSPEDRVQQATSKLFLNSFTCSDYKAGFFLKNDGQYITGDNWKSAFTSMGTDFATQLKGQTDDEKKEHATLVDQLMDAFACEDNENYCFYDWMYAAYWFSNDTVENKCNALVQLWAFANEVDGDFTEKNVTDMLECFWKVWTKVSCHLGQHTTDQCEKNFNTVFESLTKAQAKGLKALKVAKGKVSDVIAAMVEQTNKNKLQTADLWRTANLGTTWNEAATFTQDVESEDDKKKRVAAEKALADATAEYNTAKASFDKLKEGDDDYEKTEKALKVLEDKVTELTPKEVVAKKE